MHFDEPVDAKASGLADLMIFSGLEHQVSVDGVIRLPQASTNPGCTSCNWPSNHTLLAEGRIQLTEVKQSPGRSLQASFGGDLRALQLDERPMAFATLFGIESAAAVSIVAGLAIFKFLASAFFTKLKGDPLEHPRRRRIFDYIKDHPGATFREVARGVEIATGTTRHHLTVLKRNGVIMERPHGSTTRFFENHGKFDASWTSVVLLREPPLKLLHEWLSANPEVPQKDVLEAMAVHGWSRSTTQHRLQRLVEGGMAELRLQGRLKIYKASAPKPKVVPGLFVPSPTLAVPTSPQRTSPPVAPLS
jgi:predicted transcriptional regulator